MRIIYTLPLLLIAGCGQPKVTSPTERGNKRGEKNSRKHRHKRLTRDASIKIPVYSPPVTVKNDVEPTAAKMKASSENIRNAEVQTDLTGHEVHEDVSVLPVKKVDSRDSETVKEAHPVEDSKRKKNNKRSHTTQTREKATGSEHRVAAEKVRSSNDKSSREEKKKARNRETPRADRKSELIEDSNRRHTEEVGTRDTEAQNKRTETSIKVKVPHDDSDTRIDNQREDKTKADRAPVVRRNPGCDGRRVAAARGLIDNDSHDLFLIRQYAPFLTTCVQHVAGRDIEELLTEKARKALSILREVIRVPLDADFPKSREEMDAEIDLRWAQVRTNPRMIKEVVRFPNIGVLRYITGAQEGTRIMLRHGGLLALLHSKDVDCLSPCEPVQVRDTLEAMLEEPLKQLLLEAQKSKSESALFRPKYADDVRFLWNVDDRSLESEIRAQIVKPIPDALRVVNELALGRSNFVSERFVKTFKLKNPTNPASIDAVFREGINVFSPPFTLMNLQDRDKLGAVVGRGLSARLLDDRAQVVIHSLLRYSTDNCKSNCPYADLYRENFDLAQTSPARFCYEKVLPRLRNLHDIVRNSNRNYISFLVGLTAGPLMAANGFNAPVHLCTKAFTLYRELGLEKTASINEIEDAYRRLPHREAITYAYEVLSDKQRKQDYDKCGTKVSIPIWDAFFPTEDRIAQAFSFATEKQLQDLREKEIPIFEL